jgi:hypothetical protein
MLSKVRNLYMIPKQVELVLDKKRQVLDRRLVKKSLNHEKLGRSAGCLENVLGSTLDHRNLKEHIKHGSVADPVLF